MGYRAFLHKYGRANFLFLVLAFFLTSCAGNRPFPSDRLVVHVPSGYGKQAAKPVSPEKQSVPAPRTEERPSFQYLTPFRFSAGTPPGLLHRKAPFSRTREVSVAVKQMMPADFIHYIFSDLLGVNYVMDSNIYTLRQPITLNIDKKISEYQLFEMVTNVLARKKISIYGKDGIYYISMNATTGQISIGIGASVADIPAFSEKIEQLIPLKYIDSQDAYDFLAALPIGRGMRIIPATNGNILAVIGSRDNIEQALRMVNVLDRPAMRGRFVGMQALTYWDPSGMAGKLTEILKQESIPVSLSPGGKGVYINTLEQWGALLFFASERSWLERVKYWVRLLDRPHNRSARQYFLYFPKNSKAAELGESLRTILGMSAPQISKGTGAERQGVPRKIVPTVSSVIRGREKAKKSPAGEKAVIGNETNIAASVRFAVDKNRNALIICCTQKQYKVINSLLERLDVMPIQVLLEATVVTVTLKGDLQYGLEWYIKNSSWGQNIALNSLQGLLGTQGLNFSITSNTQKFQLLLNALASKNLVKVLSSTRLMVRDGKTAAIVVGSEIPVVTQTATTQEIQQAGTSGIISTVQYRSTGVSLTVKPAVQAHDVVSLDISQEVSEAQQNTLSSISSPIILNRTIHTDVVAGDGQTVLIGGLISKSDSGTVNRVPLLSSIPILGNLFKSVSKNTTKTELVIMITPHIIRSPKEIDEMRNTILKEFQYIKE